MTTRIAVLGQGPAGCSAAYHLNQVAGTRVKIDLIGQDLAGHSSTYHTPGAPPIDVGATLITDTYTLIHQLIREVGLTSQVLPLRAAMTVCRDDGRIGSLVLNEPLTLLRYSLLGPLDKLRITGPLAALVATGLFPGFDPMELASMAVLDCGRSTAQYIRAAMGRAALDNLGRLIEGLWLIPCERIAEAHFKAWFSRPTARWSVLEQGLGSVWKAVTDTLHPPHEVITGVDIGAIERAGTGYTVELVDGGGMRRVSYDALVVALPAPVIVERASDLLNAEDLTLLSTLGWVESVHAVYKVKVPAGTPPEKGLIMPCGSGTHPVAAMQLLWTSRYASRRGGGPVGDVDFVSVYASGAYSKALFGRPDAAVFKDLYATAQQELRGSAEWLDDDPLGPVVLFRQRNAIPLPTVEMRLRMVELLRRQAGRRAQLAGGWTVVPVPYSIESSARSGKAAAERLLATI